MIYLRSYFDLSENVLSNRTLLKQLKPSKEVSFSFQVNILVIKALCYTGIGLISDSNDYIQMSCYSVSCWPPNAKGI